VALAIAIGGTTTALADNRADAYARQGDQSFRAGDYANAVAAYKKALALDPKRGLVYYGLALCYHQQQQWQLAVDNWKQARALLKPEGAMLLTMGVDYYHLKKYDDALHTFQDVIAIRTPDLDQAMANYWTGVIYNTMGQPEKALPPLRQAINLKPDDADFYFELGAALSGVKQYDDAATSYKDAVRLRPGFALAYYNLGLVYLALHRTSDAEQACDKLQTLDKPKADELRSKLPAAAAEQKNQAKGTD